MLRMKVLGLSLVFVLAGLSGLALADNVVEIEESGNDNAVHIKQEGSNCTALAIQNGNNIATMEQTYSLDTWAYITQIGEGNFASQFQEGVGNFAEIFQIGNDNNTDTDCDLGKDCEDCCDFNTQGWLQYQEGDRNRTYVDIEGDHNHVAQWQDGDDNLAKIKIEGHHNLVKQIQWGGSNNSKVTIIPDGIIPGDWNTVCNYQKGYGLEYSVTITGHWPPICVIQR